MSSSNTDTTTDATVDALPGVFSPGDRNPATRLLRLGDLVRVSESGVRASRRLNDRDGHLGRIVQIAAVPAATAAATATLNPASTNMKHDDDDAAEVPTTPVKMSAAAAASNQHQDCSCLYNVEWVLGGKTMGVRRSDLAWTSAESEGFLQSTNAVENSRRDKRKPINFMEETRTKDLAKKQKQRESKLAATCSATGKNAKNAAPKRPQHQQSKPMKVNRRQPAAKAKPKAATASNKRKSSDLVKTAAAAPKGSKKQKLQQQQNETTATKTATPEETTSIEKLDLFEKHKREFERLILRLEKMDCYRHFVTAALEWEDATNNNKDNLDACPEQCTKEPTIPSASASDEIITDVENNNPCSPTTTTHCGEEGQKGETRSATLAMKSTSSPPNSALLEGSFSLAMPNQDTTNANGSSTFVTVPPCDWKSIRRRMEQGYYVVDRKLREENRRLELFAPYLESLGSKKSKRWKKEKTAKPSAATIVDFRVLYPHGIEWRLFQLDIFAMCDAAVARLGSDGKEEDDGQRGSLSYTVKRLKEAVQQVVERTGSRQETELDFADDRHKFALAVKASNTEAAMQSWRKIPFPERRYERTTTDVVCAGLSEVDEKIAAFELQTSLPDSFVGQSYRYDDTGQSEAWMKSVVDETGSGNKKTKKKNDQNDSDERLAALALIADEGVTQAQVAATMQSLLIAVQDKVMTEAGVLRQSELRSANWVAECQQQKSQSSLIGEAGEISLDQRIRESIDPTTLMPEIVEKPVWGIDCYTRRNILNCLGIEFDPRTSLLFVEKWLLPAINACPANLGHNIDNAARILEGLPFEKANAVEDECHENVEGIFASEYNESLLLNALRKKIKSSGPPWLQATANQLRRARAVLGEDFFRVHPKGHGSVVLSPTLKANALVTFYHGELYPSWRWGEKMDAIEITQKRKDLKPNLPDFYNMALERPQADPRGYGLLFVDASRKAGHGSSLSHSCAPTCEVRVAAFDGELCLAMTTLRELEMGEELTFDYNAVTESLNEYSSAVCLCGYGRCRGSFLHFATADCYQQVLNRNSPIATRFSNLVKGSMKQVMSPDDDQVLMNHGFLTASFGAISVNRRVASSVGNGDALADSLDNVPVWLRTYVADVLRYIEYERRALPIALICEHLATSKKGGQKSSTVVMTKEPKSEPAFFYFSRTESQFVLSLLKKQGMPDSLTGLQLKHAMQKVASGYWGALTDEKKQDWKNRARANFEKKLKLWRSGKRKLPDKNQEKEKSKPEIHDILHSSKISFQDADAEGVVAMEQRIQQLSQTLSRVGRALDRHREGSFDTDNRSMCETESPESLRKMVQSPIRVLSDAEVIGWMWNNSNGVFQALVRSINSARCVRPDLLEGLIQIRKKYVTLEEFRDSESDFVDQTTPSPIDSRCQLTIALLESRDLILAELQCMTREFRETRAQQMDEARTQNTSPVLSDDMIDGKLDSVISTVSPLEAHLTATPGDSSAIETFSDEIIVTATTEDVAPNEAKMSVEEKLPLLRHPWLEFYHERFTLHAAADVLLLYARTTNFFVLQPYRPLMSTPVEVYARELGNVVPRSAVDEELSLTMKEPALPTETVAGVQKQNNFLQQDSGNGIDSPINQAETKRVVVDVCNPDDVVSMVAIQYQGDYVLSQLLQWYNAGIGQKPGLPDMLGCTLLPKISDCWDSELLRNSKMKSDRKTSYETKIRPRLVEWLQDPYQRGNPWPLEIRKAFLGDSSSLLKSDTSTMFLPFGSPIVDFLVTGDESNISAILNELDADDKIAVKKSGDGLLSSIDKGRPAQAVSNWVQCEHPECMKWRKIPWFVDLDLLPENFFCEDNKWNPNSNNCNSPEDEWGASDALVGLDGKVEGSPAKKKPEERLSINDESSFQIGTRFDVQRSDKDHYSVAYVTRCDFSGSIKRIMFHFAKLSSDRDEWVEFGSPRIAPLYSKVQKKRDKEHGKAGVKKLGNKPSSIPLHPKSRPVKKLVINSSNADVAAEVEKAPRKLKPKKKPVPTDPTDENAFVVGARFDVYRHDKLRFSRAVIKTVEFTETGKKMMFHYSKTSEKYDEWIEFGSPRIFEVNSKVVKNEKKPKNAGMDMSLEKQPSVVECPMAKTLVIHTADDVVVEGNNVVSETSDANESQHTEDLSSLDQTPIVFSESVVSRESFTSNNKQGLYQDEFAGRRAEGLVSYGSESLSASEEQGQYPNITAGRRVEGGTHQCGSEPLSSNVWYTGDDLSSCSRVYGGGMNDRMQDTVALCPVVSVDRVASHGGMYAPLPEDHPGLHQQQNSSSTMHSGRSVTPGYPWNAASGFWQSSLGHTEHRDSVMPGSMNNNYNNNRVSLGYGSEEHRGSSFYNFHGPSSSRPVATAMPNSAASFPTTFGLSGLDMLAAVTNHHFVGTSSSTSPIDVPNNNNFGMMIPAHHGFGHRATIMNAAPSQQHPFGMQPPPHPPMGLNPPGPFPPFSNRPMG